MSGIIYFSLRLLKNGPIITQMSIRLIVFVNLLIISLNGYAENQRPGFESQSATVVYSSIFVTDIDYVDSAKQGFAANVYVEFRWHDPRMAVTNKLSRSVSFNEVWNPRIQVVNQQLLFKTFPETLEISQDGLITYRQRYWGNFSQPMDLRKFPMDTQHLEIQIVAVGYNEKEVLFVQNPDEPSGLADKLSQIEWKVSKWIAEPMQYLPTKNVEPLSGFHLVIHVDRDITYYIIKIIVPLCLIVAMSWLVFWIGPTDLGPKISVAITAMLTLIAYRFSIGELVPKVSYLTRLDYFIVSSILMVFLALPLVVITNNLAKTNQTRLAKRLQSWFRIIFPLIFTIVTFIIFF